jgi:hypothetical protein
VLNFVCRTDENDQGSLSVHLNKSDRMTKSNSPVSTPVQQPPNISRTLRHYHRNAKKPIEKKQPVQPTEEIVDRLNDIGKTYPFCVNYRQQSNDPL